MKTITTTPELEAAFAAFKKSDRPNIFADSVSDLCEAEIRRIHACGNTNDDASALSESLDEPEPVAVFEFENENSLERFEDGSLYEESGGDSTVWAVADNFRSERFGSDPLTVGLRDFFGQTEPEEPSCYRVTKRCFYGPMTQEGWLENEEGKPREFETKGEAQAAIEVKEEGTYYLSHNESGRPEYIITPLE